MDLNLEDFYAVHMPRISKGTGYADAVFRHEETSSEFYGAQVAWNGNGWTLTLRDGRKVYFPEAYHAKNYAQGAAIEMIDAEGRRLHLKRDKLRNLQELISPGGRTMTFKYDNADRIVEAADDTGKVLQYTYDPGGHVQTVSESGKTLYHFQYESLMNYAGYDPWLLTEILDGKGKLILRNTFYLGRVSEQTLADGQVFHYDYRLERTGKVLQTTILLPSGEKKVFSFQNGILIHQS
jgi:YD repeat-containing protein